MTTPTTPNTPAGHVRRGLLGVVLVTSVLAPLSLTTPASAAVAPATSQVVLTDITGARVGRGGAPGHVQAIVRNGGSRTATGVTVRYRLPTGIAFVAADSTIGCTLDSTVVTCALGSLLPGASLPIHIGVGEPSATGVLGTRSGYFFAPTTDQFDPEAGELLMTTWYHDAGAEGTDLSSCWPLDDPTPNMDVAGGVCDGSADTGPLEPDDVAVIDAFPAPFSQSLTRSWEFATEITVPATGQYHACGTMIDDGGYLAIAPVGEPLDPSSVAVSVPSYGSATGSPVTLVGGRRYRVVMRISNHGSDGIDNGANGGTLAGWDAFGIAPAAAPCGVPDAAVFGTADTAWIGRTAADVSVVGSSDLSVSGAIESAPVRGRREARLSLANTGHDASDLQLAIGLPPDGVLQPVVDGCDRSSIVTRTCDVVELGPASTERRVIAFSFSGATPGTSWTLTPAATIDDDPSDNAGSLAATGS